MLYPGSLGGNGEYPALPSASFFHGIKDSEHDQVVQRMAHEEL